MEQLDYTFYFTDYRTMYLKRFRFYLNQQSRHKVVRKRVASLSWCSVTYYCDPEHTCKYNSMWVMESYNLNNMIDSDDCIYCWHTFMEIMRWALDDLIIKK